MNTTAPVSPSSAAAPHTLDDSEYELKFAVDARQVSAVRDWMRALCQPDGRYPTGAVNSIYFDTPVLQHLREKVNSDYLKTKVRVRWYDVPGGGSSASFLEAKFRIGPRRRKFRMALPCDSATLSSMPLDAAFLAAIPAALRALGVPVSSLLRPVLVIRYRRDRFVEPLSAVRVSLDTDIVVPAVNPSFIPVVNPLPLSIAVLEVKGQRSALPRKLRHIIDFGARKISFSKYLACYDHATYPCG